MQNIFFLLIYPACTGNIYDQYKELFWGIPTCQWEPKKQVGRVSIVRENQCFLSFTSFTLDVLLFHIIPLGGL